MKLSRVLSMLAVSLLLSSSLLAVPSYGANSFAVSDATLTHGLGVWGLYDGDPSTLVRLSFESGSQLVVNADSTASLNGFVEVVDLDGGPGAIGELWDITVELVYRGTGPEGEGSGGPRYLSDKTFTDNWEYYDIVGAVMIRADDSSDVVVLTQFPPGSVFPFQLGFGASGKNLDFGASVDFSYERAIGGAIVTEGNAALFVDVNLIGEVDLSVTIQDTPDPVTVGELVIYSITISNAGPQLAVPVTLEFLTDFPNSAFVSAQTNSTGGSCNTIPIVNLTVECSLPVVDPGETVDSTIVIRPFIEGEFSVVAHVDSPQSDFNEPNFATALTTVVEATGADLAVSISDTPDPVLVNAVLTYDIVVTNNGPQTATDLTLEFFVQGGIDNLATSTPECALIAQGVTCNFVSLSAAETIPIQITGTVTETPGNIILSAASVSATEGDGAEQNNVATEDTIVSSPAGVDLGTVITDMPDPVLANGSLTYQVRWFNSSNTSASEAIALFVLDPRATFLSFTLSGSGVSDSCAYLPPTRRIECTFFNVAPSQVLSLEVNVQPQPAPTTAPGAPGSTYILPAAANIQSVVEPDAFDANNSDEETTTVFTCISDEPCLRGILYKSDTGTYGCAFVPDDNATCSAPCFNEGICNAGTCELGEPLVCADNPDECSDNECNPATGACESVDEPDESPCDDGFLCSTGGICIAGECLSGPPVVCEDGNICTDDFCDPNTGECTFAINSDPCDDGNVCNDACFELPCDPGTFDQCVGGVCVGNPENPGICDDGNACTTDSCNPDSGCVWVPTPGVICGIDDDLCAGLPTCDEIGACVQTPVDCNDENLCTTDFCVSTTGQCGNDPVICDQDGNVCTTNSCDPASGACEPYPVAGSCNDANVCTTVDQCIDGECVGSSEFVCDPTICADFACDPTGVGPNCNIATYAGPAVQCREGSGDICDPSEVCIDGEAECPADIIADSSTVCDLGSGDICDPDEMCSGVAGEACPSGDTTLAAAGTVCESGSGDICDPEEICSGIEGEACPSGDTNLAASGTVCNAGSGDVCDPDEVCSGLPGESCPADVFEPATTVCRNSTTGDTTCDPSESCTGVAGDACPDNMFANAGTLCGNSAMSACTEPDSCDGVGVCEFNNTACGFVTDSGLCEFDAEPTKGDCSTDGSACVFDLSCAETGGVTCTTGGTCLDAFGANIGACVPDGICGANCDQSNQFRLVFTPDVKNWPAYKLNASNPGQTFYNVMYDGSQELLDGDDVNLAVTIPYPYVTVGGMPLHVYAGDTVPSNDLGCLVPEEPLFSEPLVITLDDWINGTTGGSYGLSCDAVSGPNGAGSCTFEVTVPNVDMPAGGLLYVNLHLDYGLKGKFVDANPVGPYPLDAEMVEDRYDRRANVSVWGSSDALVNTATDDGPIALEDCRSYWFEHTDGAAVPLFQDQVQNLNIFKQIAGAFGRVWCADNGDGFDYYVQLVSPSGNWIKRTQADEDGYYALNHKHKGKPAYYTVEVYANAGYSDFVHSTLVELQGNGWAEVSFWNSCSTTDAWDSSVTYGKGRRKNK